MSLRTYSDQEQDDLLNPPEHTGLVRLVPNEVEVPDSPSRTPETPLDPVAAQTMLVQRVVQLTQQVSRLTEERDHLRTRIRTLTSLVEGYRIEEQDAFGTDRSEAEAADQG